MKAVYKLFSFLGIALYLLAPVALPIVASAQQSQRLFYATPSSGAAPLTVDFTSNGMVSQNFYRIDFGDDEVSNVSSLHTSHTYTAAGTYTAQFMYAPNQCAGVAAPCTQPNPAWQTLDTGTVTVTAHVTSGSGSLPTCTMSVSPSHINVGGSVTLRWSSTNATAGAITNVGNVGPSGSVNLLPSSAAFTTYIGSFTGPRGTANCSATVSVGGNGGGTSGAGDGTAGNPTDFTTQTPDLGTGGGTQNATLGNTTATPAPTAATPASTVPTNTSGGALVTCGTGVFDPNNPTASATGCQACDLASLIQNIINFLIGISIPVAAALFAWAGVLYFTSAGDHHKLDQAKGIFRNAFIGFLIIISAWLVINTLLHVLFSQGEFANGNWFTIQCSTSSGRPVNTSIGTVLGNLLGTAQVTNNVVSTSPTPGNGYSTIPSGFVLSDDGKTIVPVGGDFGQPSGYTLDSQGNIVPIASNNDIAAAAAAYYGTNTSAGPDGGNLACAWAVNNILQSQGIPSIDGNSVDSMENALNGGRGTYVDTSNAQAGDIIIWKSDTVSHVGICQNAGCSSAISNSSANATFTNVSGPTLMGTPGRVYHVK